MGGRGAVRSAVDNPFLPGSDAVPAVWAGRAANLSDWRDVVRPRRVHGVYERGRALLGEPGIGKSVLAHRIAAAARAAGDLVVPTVRVPLGADVVTLLAQALLDAVDGHDLGATLGRRAGGLLDRVRSVSTPVGGAQLAPPADQPNRHRELHRLLVELGGVAAGRGSAVLLCVGEVQNVTDRAALSQTLIAVGDALAEVVAATDAAGTVHERVLPLTVYLTGLPEFADRATSVAGATFARRFQPVLLTHLDDADIRLALADFTDRGWPVLTTDGPTDGPATVVMTDAAVDALVDRCLGDPFLFQLAGKAAWDAGRSATITDADVRTGWSTVTREARRHVEASLARLPATERAFVEAMAALPGPQRTLSRIAEAMGRSATDVATTARRLEDVRGVLERGRPYRFTARTLAAYLSGGWP